MFKGMTPLSPARLARAALALLALALAPARGARAQGMEMTTAGSVRVLHLPRHLAIAGQVLAAARTPVRFPGIGPVSVPESTTVILAPDPRAFAAATGGDAQEWAGGVAIPALRRIVLPVYPAARVRDDDRGTILRHEIAHLVVAARMGTRVPRWFDEGYAEVASGGWDVESAWQLRLALASGAVPPVDSLALDWPGGERDARLAYLLSATAVDYLRRRGGERGMALLFANARREGDFEAALRTTYGITLGQLEDEWRGDVRSRYGWLALLSNAAIVWLFATALVLAAWIPRRRRDRRRLRAMEAEERMLPPPRALRRRVPPPGGRAGPARAVAPSVPPCPLRLGVRPFCFRPRRAPDAPMRGETGVCAAREPHRNGTLSQLRLNFRLRRRASESAMSLRWMDFIGRTALVRPLLFIVYIPRDPPRPASRAGPFVPRPRDNDRAPPPSRTADDPGARAHPDDGAAQMTPESKVLVQESWSAVEPIADTAAELFYGRLFEIDPSLKPLFRGDMKEQGKKLMQMITVAVRSLDRLDTIVPAVEALGRRHVGYGVTDGHYDTVASALLWTLEKGLGEKFTAAVKDAWVETYTLLATVMKRAAAGEPGVPPTVPVHGHPGAVPA